MNYNRTGMGQIYSIGTAGWSYKDWENIVYPARKPHDFHPLIYLSQWINAIEINSTFYRPPQSPMTQSWVKKVASHPDFRFSVKLHQTFTHKRNGYSVRDIDIFKRGVDPLMESGRLAALLIQFPWSFRRTSTNQAYLDELFRKFSGYPQALEVRHGSWNQPDFYRFLSEHGVIICNIDQPLFRDSIPPGAICTNPEMSYVRLHGRNYTNWFKDSAGRDARYDYLYEEKELDEWIDRIKKLAGKSSRVLIITNNHYRGQAFTNALQIKNKLTGEKLEIPESLLQRYPALNKIAAQIRRDQLGLFAEKIKDAEEKKTGGKHEN